MIQRNDLLSQILAKFKAVGAADERVKLFSIRNLDLMGKDSFSDATPGVDAGDDIHGYCLDDTNVFLSLGTTRPGLHAYEVHPDGAGYMAVGFHKKIWVIDTHAANNPSFAHEALCQRSWRGCQAIAFWRDAKKEFKQGNNPIQHSTECCMNMHRASVQSDLANIGLYGEGCMVRNNHIDHETMMNQIKKVPEVAATYNEKTKQYSYLFSFLLTESTEWQGL